MAGYSGKPLSQKPGLKPGFRIFVEQLVQEASLATGLVDVKICAGDVPLKARAA